MYPNKNTHIYITCRKTVAELVGILLLCCCCLVFYKKQTTSFISNKKMFHFFIQQQSHTLTFLFFVLPLSSQFFPSENAIRYIVVRKEHNFMYLLYGLSNNATCTTTTWLFIGNFLLFQWVNAFTRAVCLQVCNKKTHLFSPFHFPPLHLSFSWLRLQNKFFFLYSSSSWAQAHSFTWCCSSQPPTPTLLE